AGMAARGRGLLSPLLRRPGDGADGGLSDRHTRPPRAPRSRRPAPPPRGRACRRLRSGEADMTPVLKVEGLSNRFGGITPLADVSVEVAEGEILGIIGPNGSGKSTLFNCVLGQLRPSEGQVYVDGRAITGMRPCELNRLGVGRTFQLLQVFPELSLFDNLILA